MEGGKHLYLFVRTCAFFLQKCLLTRPPVSSASVAVVVAAAAACVCVAGGAGAAARWQRGEAKGPLKEAGKKGRRSKESQHLTQFKVCFGNTRYP